MSSSESSCSSCKKARRRRRRRRKRKEKNRNSIIPKYNTFPDERAYLPHPLPKLYVPKLRYKEMQNQLAILTYNLLPQLHKDCERTFNKGCELYQYKNNFQIQQSYLNSYKEWELTRKLTEKNFERFLTTWQNKLGNACGDVLDCIFEIHKYLDPSRVCNIPDITGKPRVKLDKTTRVLRPDHY